MTSLVTGGAGFLGSNLVGALLSRGERVIVLDNFMIGSKDNLAEFSEKNLVVMEHDIRWPIQITEPIDRIWNLACIASPVHYVKYPIETIETNTLGVPNVLRLALEKKAQVLHTSTSEVYGDALEHPQRETYWGNVNSVGAHACYKESKRIAETIISSYARISPELDIRMVRIFNTYGPKMALNDGRMLSEFILRALQKGIIRVDGDGKQTRSACYVDDLVAGLVAVMEHSDVTRNQIINLGNPEERTVKDFAETVVRLVGQGNIEHIAAREDDVQKRCPDITKAKKLLGWAPTVDLETGLEKTIAWMKTRLSEEQTKNTPTV